MSERTAQCQECTDVFECAARGKLPSLCPKCMNGAAERPAAAPKRRKNTGAHSTNGTSPAIATAILALQEEIVALEDQISTRQEALKALGRVA